MAPQVLVLGMPRTGTQSLGEALRTLGHQNVYHMTSVGPNNHHDKWVAALEAKFESKGTEFTRQDFDEILGDFDAVSDFPCSIFYRELMSAYPTASLILSTRPEDAWYTSMSKTLHLAYTKAQSSPSKLAKMYNYHLWGNDFLAHGREAFRTHNAGVIAAAAEQGREVLIFDPSQGWESLCGFLGKDVPQGVKYPSKDMWVPYKQMVSEVEAGRLTEDSITIGKNRGKALPAFMSAYIYTQKELGNNLKEAEKDTITLNKKDGKELPPFMAAYIYTQSGGKPEETKDSIVIDKNGGKELPPFLAAYIYTQSGGKPEETNDSVVLDKSAGKELPPFLAAYIYTQSAIPEDVSEGIKAAYIYTQ
ncbi:hypothetical protein BLS_000904 [Venturia inaequalis]|uniref:Uncharacterized protein n=1 Tax=Venturia inaequalis TaxID=5025 RepID=A0A8H3V1Y3_VENIN|nr:hypothetical protein BLS_000904 [Venturia inaequalis]KAE9963596.1 hypothetical protein EG328_011282 [Venturia inaequalis]KAE9980555.1 hypothetical protein EG327_006522 [Venturia inaequalis]RDI83529.1 hypothetical protein Vi05172_g6575 [Venturia inaequalis]